ncbi:MAG TPA: hypothetical protein VF758_02820 [Candidatus Acidoferrum sp.]
MSLAIGADETVYLGTADGHVFARTTAAAAWELRGRVGDRLDAVVTRLLSDPQEPKRLLAAVWFQQPAAGGGVFVSDDAGRTWKRSGLEGEAVRALEAAPSQPGLLVAGTLTGVFLSHDAARTWQRISPTGDNELRNVDSVAVDPRDARVIYAGTYHLPWKTVDAGTTWRPVAAGLIDDSDVMSVHVDAANPRRVFLSACSGIYRSENEGASWTKLQGIPYSSRRTPAIVQDPGNAKTLFAATTEGLWVTRDAGENWKRTTPRGWVVNAVAVLPHVGAQPEELFLGTESQGVLVSEDSGETFAPANSGFTHVVVERLVNDPGESGHLLIVTEGEHRELRESRDGGKSWQNVPLERAPSCRAATGNPAEIAGIYGTAWGWVLRSRNGKLWLRDRNACGVREWNLYLSPETAKSRGRDASTGRAVTFQRPRISSLEMAFSRDAALIPAVNGLLRCPPSGICERLKAFQRLHQVDALWTSTDGRWIAVVSAGKFGISSDAGAPAAWRDLPGKDGALWLQASDDFAQHPVYLGTVHGAFRSTDGGTRWDKLAGGLPDAAVDQWLTGGGYILASLRQGAVYLSLDGGSNWRRIDSDAARGRITGFVEIQPGVVLAGSQSEGILGLNINAHGQSSNSAMSHWP